MKHVTSTTTADESTVTLCVLAGAADLCELMAAALEFPSKELAIALGDGRFADDAVACLRDAVAPDGAIKNARIALEPLRGEQPEKLLDTMRKGYSLLFLSPGNRPAVWPYESAFCALRHSKKGAPVGLTRSPCALDVRKRMSRASFVPNDKGQEPWDSIWSELSFMARLLGCAVACIARDDEPGDAGSTKWLDEARSFWAIHLGKWLGDFAQSCRREARECTYAGAYGHLAEFIAEGAQTIGDTMQKIDTLKEEAP